MSFFLHALEAEEGAKADSACCEELLCSDLIRDY